LFIVIGLVAVLPFAIACSGGLSSVLHAYSNQFGDTASLLPPASAWGGNNPWAWQWTDSGLLLIFGGIPWQVYFQRVLASRNPKNAVQLSVASGFACLVVAIPAVLIGCIGATFDWSQFPDGGPSNPALVLPYVLRYLTPPVIALLGLTAVAAAVMSSVDSSILSASTLFSWNVYRPLLQKREDDAKTRQVTRIAVVIIGLFATLLALSVKSVYTLWFLCADLVYVILFPQLLMALFCKNTNQVGALAGVAVGLVLRLGGGESALGLHSFIAYPFQDLDHGTFFPFRTFAMLASLVTIWAVSRVTRRWNPPLKTNDMFFGKQSPRGESS
jgi:high affinity choline transporter 7